MASNFDDVGAFHEKFGLPFRKLGEAPHELDEETSQLRVDRLQEELDEYTKAVAEHDLPGQFDALIDLVYIALGTAHHHAFPWQAGWDAVQRANMAKRRAKPDGSDSKHGSALDIVKPEGWTPPAIDVILESYGYNNSQVGC